MFFAFVHPSAGVSFACWCLHYSVDSLRRAFKRFQTIVGAVTLRRTKKDTIEGKPIIDLPARNCEMREHSFKDPKEIEFYQAVEKNSMVQLGKMMSEGGGLRSQYSGIMLLLLRLRQACCHPYLIEHAAHKSGRNVPFGESSDVVDDPDFTSPYSSEALDKAMELADAGMSSFDLLTDVAKEMAMARLAPPPQPPKDAFEELADSTHYPCDICKVSHQCGMHRILPVGNIICRRCAAQILAETTNGMPENDPFLELDDVRRDVHARIRSVRLAAKAQQQEQLAVDAAAKVSGAPRELKRLRRAASSQGVAALTKGRELMQGEGPNSSSAVPAMETTLPNGDAVPLGMRARSTKIDTILEVLNAMRDRNVEEKALIFSQWTSMMDIIGVHIGLAGFEFCRLDGTMVMEKRRLEIERFKKSRKITVFLISMHAGGTGLNLTEANNVILADCWFNPSVEEQCCDRAHRIGQRKAVTVTRLKIAGSVEERIFAMQKRKAEVCKGALGEEGAQSLGRQKMTLEDALDLFGNAAQNVLHQTADADSDARRAAEDVANILRGGEGGTRGVPF
jgi:SNF2 family DNA or RNA helicase